MGTLFFLFEVIAAAPAGAGRRGASEAGGGTPTGAGARFDPPIWLKPGDVVEIMAEGIGTLRNTIADEVIP